MAGLESPFVAAPHNVKLLQAQCAHAGIPGREIRELLNSVVLFILFWFEREGWFQI